MKKYTLQEESSRIKNMMGIREDLQSPMDEKSIGSVSDVIDYVTNVSEKVEIIASDMSADFEGTEFWDYVKPMYSGLRSVSDMEGMYTRGDQQSENVSNVIDRLKSEHGDESDLNEADWNSPEERERIRMYNETSKGATMVLQSIDKLFDSINREAYHRCRRAIEGVLKELHYEVNNPQESSVENDDYPGIRISDIKQDERQERNYGVEDLNELGGYIGNAPEKIDGPFMKEIDPSVYEDMSYLDAMKADILLMRLYRSDIISKNAFLEVRKPVDEVVKILKGGYEEKQKDLPF